MGFSPIDLKVASTFALDDNFAVQRGQVDLSGVKGAGATFSAAWQPIENGVRTNSAVDDEELIGLGVLLVLVLVGLVVVVVLINYFAT